MQTNSSKVALCSMQAKRKRKIDAQYNRHLEKRVLMFDCPGAMCGPYAYLFCSLLLNAGDQGG